MKTIKLDRKYSRELIDFVKKFANDSWKMGYSLDTNSASEFQAFLRDNDFDVFVDEATELLNYYFELYESYKGKFFDDE